MDVARCFWLGCEARMRKSLFFSLKVHIRRRRLETRSSRMCPLIRYVIMSTTRSRRTCYVDHSDSLTTRHSGLRSPRTRPLHFPQLSHVSYRKHTSKLSHPSLSLTPTQPAQGWGLPARYSASGTTAPATARLGPHFLGGEAAREGAGERWGLRPALHHGAPPLLLDLGSKAPQILWQHRSLGE